ncbi:MAG: class I tRNA ligase family protein, partial [Chloroflexi bacterium]|nr:class I tRNA ligase family protein [Chloroflexota bacterium]
ALRFTLLTGGTPGNDMKLSTTRVEANRNFANKIWNAARFVLMALAGAPMELAQTGDSHAVTYALPDPAHLILADRWILSRLETVRENVTRLVGDWQLGEAGRQLYDFLWSEYCDWYIEAAKNRLYGGDAAAAQATRQVLAFVLEQSMRLMHPYMPFVTEAIWNHLPGVAAAGEALMTSRWPASSGLADATAEEQFGRLQEMIRAVRNARSEYNVEPGRRVAALIAAGEHTSLVQANVDLLVSQAKIEGESLQVAAELAPPEKAVALAVGGVTLYLPLAGLVDMDAERKRLQKEVESVEQQIARIDGLLGNEGFLAKAPEQVVGREKAKLEELRGRRVQLQANLADLG